VPVMFMIFAPKMEREKLAAGELSAPAAAPAS